jgi:uncharacterized protein with PIN domain
VRILPTSQKPIFQGLRSIGKTFGVFGDLLQPHSSRKDINPPFTSCEACNPEGAQIPFDNILDRVTGSDPKATDYILEEPAKCPNCRREILRREKEWRHLEGELTSDFNMRQPHLSPDTHTA